MAKERRTNSAVSALGSLLSTIGTVAKIELKDNPEALAEVDKMVADTKDSNYMTAAANLDDSIETQHQVEEVLDAAGLDLTQINRENAVAGAIATANMAVEVDVAEPIETD